MFSPAPTKSSSTDSCQGLTEPATWSVVAGVRGTVWHWQWLGTVGQWAQWQQRASRSLSNGVDNCTPQEPASTWLSSTGALCHPWQMPPLAPVQDRFFPEATMGL
jgi:hypothetical protein